MSIGDVGYFPGNAERCIEFWSNDNFSDFNVLRLTISSIKEELNDIFTYKQGAPFSDNVASELTNLVKKKRIEIDEFYKLKGDVVIMLDSWPIIQYRNKYGDTVKVDLLNIFLGDMPISYVEKVGSTISPSPPFQNLISRARAKYYYTLKTNQNVKVLATTVKTREILSLVTRMDNGRLLLLNDLLFNGSSYDGFNEWLADEIRRLFSLLNENLAEIAEFAPDWMKDVEMESQGIVKQELDDLNVQKIAIENEIAIREQTVLKYEILKSILFTTGKPLESGICYVLDHLCIKYIVPQGSQTDLIIHEKERYIAIEIKGVSGSASLRNTRQLEDWVNRTADTYDQDDVKGLLIINAFNHLPIPERVDVVFPPNVIEFSRKRGHCLLTTVSLFNMIADFDRGALSKDRILELILMAEGVLDYHQISAT